MSTRPCLTQSTCSGLPSLSKSWAGCNKQHPTMVSYQLKVATGSGWTGAALLATARSQLPIVDNRLGNQDFSKLLTIHL
jgi:hypothetical protein